MPEATNLTNKQKYDQIFMKSFSVDEAALTGNLEYNKIAAWDSIGHMELVAAIEEAFNIVMEGEDIINLSSYQKGFEILAKYKIEF